MPAIETPPWYRYRTGAQFGTYRRWLQLATACRPDVGRAQVAGAQGTRLRIDRQAEPVVGDLKLESLPADRDVDPDHVGVGVDKRIVDGLLRDPVRCQIDPSRCSLDIEEFAELARDRGATVTVIQALKVGGPYVGLGQEANPDGVSGPLLVPLDNPDRYER